MLDTGVTGNIFLLKALGAKRAKGNRCFTLLAVTDNMGIKTVIFVLDTTFANPLLNAGVRDVKMFSDLIFIDVVLADIFFYLGEKLVICANRADV